MRWLSVVRTSIRFRWFAALVVFSGLHSAPVLAVAANSGTQITAEVCQAPLGSTISINQPASDSTVQTANVIVKGAVSNATQITVSIDGNYSQTVPLGASDTSFSFTVTLTKGTHTIKLVANDVCQIQNSSDTVVLTFTGSSGIGSQTPTSAGGVQVGVGEPIKESEQTLYQKLRGSAVVGPALGVIEKTFAFTGLDTTIERNSLVATFVRVGVFTVGMTTLTFTTVAAQSYAAIPAEWIRKLLPSGNPMLEHTYLMMSLRVGGLLLMFLAALA